MKEKAETNRARFAKTDVLLVCAAGVVLLFCFYQISGPVQSYPEAEQRYININTATLQEITMLPNIGTKRAEAILDWRERYGPFSSPEELLQVEGIGQAVYKKIAPYVVTE